MASSSRSKSVSGASWDLTSQLPSDVKDMILERLPTRDAARSVLLSNEWKDAWLHHGRLVFDWDFFDCVRRFKGNRHVFCVKIINDILSSRAGPVKKFTLCISCLDVQPLQSNLDRWCLFLSTNGVEELNICIYDGETEGRDKYRLPDCIVSCPTIKRLKLSFITFGWPANAPIFSNITKLTFRDCVFEPNVNGIVSCIPSLEKLSFSYCYETDNFKISAPKLVSLSAKGWFEDEAGWTQFTLHWKTIKTLCLSGYFVLGVSPAAISAATFPVAINLQVITLPDFNFSSRQHLTFVMLLLRNSPKLCELNILAIEDSIRDEDDDEDDDSYNDDVDMLDKEAASRILEDPKGCFINRDLKMLSIVEIELFSGSVHELLFLKVLLSNSPSLEKVVIKQCCYGAAPLSLETVKELLDLPLLSQKAKLVSHR